jgi:hypothetical protein
MSRRERDIEELQRRIQSAAARFPARIRSHLQPLLAEVAKLAVATLGDSQHAFSMEVKELAAYVASARKGDARKKGSSREERGAEDFPDILFFSPVPGGGAPLGHLWRAQFLLALIAMHGKGDKIAGHLDLRPEKVESLARARWEVTVQRWSGLQLPDRLIQALGLLGNLDEGGTEGYLTPGQQAASLDLGNKFHIRKLQIAGDVRKFALDSGIPLRIRKVGRANWVHPEDWRKVAAAWKTTSKSRAMTSMKRVPNLKQHPRPGYLQGHLLEGSGGGRPQQ